jgi:hypothetical protein
MEQAACNSPSEATRFHQSRQCRLEPLAIPAGYQSCCGCYANVERIAILKRKASEPLLRQPKKFNTATDFVYYQSASAQKINKVSATKVGKRPNFRFFIDHNSQYFLLRCMLDLGSTSFLMSPEAAKDYSIPVIKRTNLIKARDVSGNSLKTENLFTIPLGLSFSNDRTYIEEDHTFEVIKALGDYNALIPAWYLEKDKARGTMTSHLHFPHCQSEGYKQEKI